MNCMVALAYVALVQKEYKQKILYNADAHIASPIIKAVQFYIFSENDI